MEFQRRSVVTLLELLSPPILQVNSYQISSFHIELLSAIFEGKYSMKTLSDFLADYEKEGNSPDETTELELDGTKITDFSVSFARRERTRRGEHLFALSRAHGGTSDPKERALIHYVTIYSCCIHNNASFRSVNYNYPAVHFFPPYRNRYVPYLSQRRG